MRMRFWIFLFCASLAAEPPKTIVERVEFSTDFPADQLHKQLQNLRARTLVPGWSIRPEYSEQAAAADVHRLQSYLIASGYLDAKVEQDAVRIADGKAIVPFKVTAGALYNVPPNWSRDLCRCLLDQRRDVERTGALDFAASFDAATRALATQAGPPYRLGRLEFRGHRKLKDAALRKFILLDEGDLLDSGLLRKSLARLTATGLVEPMKEDSVRLRIRASERIADVVIHVTEQKGNRWQISGPMGPVSFAGPLQASISSRLHRGAAACSTCRPMRSPLVLCPPRACLPGASKERCFRSSH